MASATTPDSGTERKAPARVLLVDDEPAISRSLARILTAAGHVVSTARSGEEAVAQFGTAMFDVIVSDIRMPGMDGLTLLRSIRAKDLDIRWRSSRATRRSRRSSRPWSTARSATS
jgi:CheY-like chemotaxis protein